MGNDETRRAGTIVLIHDMWMTALSWEHWVRRYSDMRHQVVARSWPGIDGIDPLRADPSLTASLGLADIVDHYERSVRVMKRPPILIGHGVGGLVVQILLDHGLGSAGVAINSTPVN